MSASKVGRIVQRQNLKQENKALKNILQKVEIVVKAERVLEDAFNRGVQVGRQNLLAEQANEKRAGTTEAPQVSE